MMTKRYDIALLFRLWSEGVHVDEIARQLGCAPSSVAKLRQAHKVPNRPRPEKPTIDPTPDEIRDRAAYCRMMRERGTPIGGV